MICIVVVDGDPVMGMNRVVQRTHLGIDERGAVYEDLGLVRHPGRERPLESDEVIRGMVDGLDQIEGNGGTVRAADQADVALSSSIEHGLVVDAVIRSQEPGIFVDGGWSRVRKQVGIGQPARCARRVVNTAAIKGPRARNGLADSTAYGMH